MKTVLLLRHAKSYWGNPELTDFERPLAKRGRKDAPRIGNLLKSYDSVPDLIISSSAKRAKQTAKLVAETCNYKKEIEFTDDFYEASSDDLILALQKLPNEVERVMLVGHNPTMEDTAADLLIGESYEWQTSLSIKMPTAGLICFDIPITEWPLLNLGSATLRWFIIPKLIKAIT